MKESSNGNDEIDRIDRRILHLLQRDGRMTNADLAQAVNVSPATCHRRTQRLFDDGYIRSVRAEVAPEKVDRSALVIVGVVLDRSTPESFADFEKAAQKVSGCMECHVVTGEFDYFMLVRTKDSDSFSRLHAEQLLYLPGVRQVRSFVVLKEILSTTSVPV